MDYEASKKYYMETGKCDWCLGKKEIVVNAGQDNEYTAKCSICGLQDEDPDSYKDNEENR